MSAVQEAIGQENRGLRRLRRRPCCWPLLTMPTSLIVYVVAVLACDLALTGWKLAGTPLRAGDLLLLVALPPVIWLQRSLMHQQLAAAARTDPKTGLLNAIAWQREADGEVARALRAGTPLALLLVDVDHFKRVNDNHGHLIGDEVLRALTTELRQQVRESDVVGRFGGEEFTVLLPRTDDAGAYGIAERLRASAGRLSVSAADVHIGVTVSIGVAVLGQHGHDLFELLAAADVALYKAKEAGRDQVRVYAHAQVAATATQAAATQATAQQEGDEATDGCP